MEEEQTDSSSLLHGAPSTGIYRHCDIDACIELVVSRCRLDGTLARVKFESVCPIFTSIFNDRGSVFFHVKPQIPPKKPNFSAMMGGRRELWKERRLGRA